MLDGMDADNSRRLAGSRDITDAICLPFNRPPSGSEIIDNKCQSGGQTPVCMQTQRRPLKSESIPLCTASQHMHCLCVTDVEWSVSVCVCLLDTTVSPAKTAEPIGVLFASGERYNTDGRSV